MFNERPPVYISNLSFLNQTPINTFFIIYKHNSAIITKVLECMVKMIAQQ